MSDWPFVARDVELRDAEQALHDGFRGVVLAGATGVGKSALARALAEQLEAHGCAVRFALGTETGQSVPLGAFHRALTSTDALDPTVMLAAAYEALAPDPELVIVVDDAQHLDPLSALLVQQLAVHGSPKLILTVRSGASTSDAVSSLWKEQLLLRMDLEPFSRDQTRELIATVMRGDVDARAVDELHRYSSGSPLYLRGVVNAARDDQALVFDAGRWRLCGKLRASADLRALVATRLDTLTAEERDVVEVVSTAEVLDWDVLVEACDIDAVTRVERRGAVGVLNDAGCTVVQPGHPIVGEVARSSCSETRTRQINTRLAVLLGERLEACGDGGSSDVRARLQLARFMVGGDVSAAPDVITEAAASAVTMSNLALGEHLARYALDHGGGAAAAVVLAEAMSWQGHGEQAEELLTRWVPDSDDVPMLFRWVFLRASNLFFGCARADRAEAVLDLLRDRERGPRTVSPVAAMEAVFAFFAGALSDAIALGAPMADNDKAPHAQVCAALATAGALALAGRSNDATAVAQTGERAAERCDSGLQRYWLAFARVSADLTDGNPADAQQVCDRYGVLAAGFPQAESIVVALSGRVEMARGALSSACEALHAAVWATPQRLPPGWSMVAAAWLSQAEGMRGDGAAAAAALARAEAVGIGSVRVFGPELDLARAWVAAATGDSALAGKHAMQAAHSAKASGMAAVELTALHTAMRFGDTSGHRQVSRLVRRCPGRLAEAIGAHSLGLACHDPEQLSAAADRFEAIGALALAADAAAHAAGEYVRSGCRGRSWESAARALWLSGQTGALTPALRCVEDRLPLTLREWEIVSLVGAGLHNRQIADRLCLSVRTVDGHLYRIFAKLGVEDRTHLARLARFAPGN
ncbi:LuxR family transcriptional regulator [Mycobacterium sp. GA-1841]|uniref:helix-turn-helix transcriptional regulator n=1 Tax=Mycobacterium sp. GA-1841 TaxID=1834154 RepID=UPI00096D0C2C|nr:LuxR family transcriptional regulator [Mycobacterium sp. GA-1841]OMC41247.1 LuxR family transcriptional regulator [Mycobacterium sp. GA-1841]